ncbi:hypothetical protein F4604DRAFT_1876324 [Suillus subluteus]|nr:hypothetical protein F4604DRAFT_1876324 [Suillus subluteus]
MFSFILYAVYNLHQATSLRSVSSTSALAAVHRGPTLATVSGIHALEVAPSFGVVPPQCRSMFVQMETTPNDNSLKFIPGLVLKPEIYSILCWLATFGSQEDRETAGPQNTQILDTDSETVVMIKELLETHVRPTIMEDGGDMEYREFSDEGLVKVQWKESCRRCSSSVRMLIYYMPEVKGVKGVEQEVIALDELAKLEQRLVKNGKNKDSR